MNTLHPRVISRVRISFFIIVIFVSFVFVMILRDTGLFTYRPQADEVDGYVHSEIINRESTESLSIDADKLPDCIEKFVYIPEVGQNETSCFVQFQCADKDKNDNKNFCKVTQGQGECSLDVSIDRCLNITHWMSEASSLCGCSSQ